MNDAAADLAERLRAVRVSESARRRERTLTGAALAGDLERVRVFLDAGADVEERSIGFASPIQAAAGAGRLAVVELLLERGADPREKPECLFSPLSAAAGHGNIDVVRRLMTAIGELSGETRAVAQAAAHGHLACLDLLLDAGAPLGSTRATPCGWSRTAAISPACDACSPRVSIRATIRTMAAICSASRSSRRTCRARPPWTTVIPSSLRSSTAKSGPGGRARARAEHRPGPGRAVCRFAPWSTRRTSRTSSR